MPKGVTSTSAGKSSLLLWRGSIRRLVVAGVKSQPSKPGWLGVPCKEVPLERPGGDGLPPR